VAFQTHLASFEFIHEPIGGAKKVMDSSSPLDLLKYFHVPNHVINLLGIHLHHGVLTLPPGRFSPFHETHRFSIAALTIPNPLLPTLATLPAAFFTWRFLRTHRTRSAPGFSLTPNTPGPSTEHAQH